MSWFAALAQGITLSEGRVIPCQAYLEACENYQKQSWRNRCRIFSSQGVENLLVPVVHEGGTHTLPITRIRVDYSTPWVVRTQRAITSAYRSSAFFEYYMDPFFAILDSHPETLWELNLTLIRFFLDKMGLPVSLVPTEKFVLPGSGVCGRDYREAIHPKRPNAILAELQLEKPYFQVFSGKYGFQSDLSVMDLLFNEGPDSILFLKKQ